MAVNEIVVSCAPPGVGRGGNIGMNTVDLAIHTIVQELGLSNRVRLCRPWEPYIKNEQGRYPDQYSLDRWPMEISYDIEALGGGGRLEAVLFWGDFQHGRDYLYQSAKRMQQVYSLRGVTKSLDECLDRCYSYFLLEDRVDVTSEMHISAFGGTLFQNRIRDYLDQRYARALSNIYRKAEFVRLRDPYSAAKVAELRNDCESSYLGVDPALLNRPEDLLALDRSGAKALANFEGAVGVFVGRSSKGLPLAGLARFTSRIAKQLRKNVVWIPWSRHTGGLIRSLHGRLRWLVRSLYAVPDDVPITSGDVLAMIEACSLIITDTYHVAISAIVLGVPALLVYEPSPRRARDANMGFRESWRDKRALFYLTYDMSDFLVPSTDLKSRRFRDLRAANICTFVRDPAATKAAYQGVLASARASRELLKAYIRSVANADAGKAH